MKHSESFASLAGALVAAQADIRAVEKSATNPHFKSKYVPLDAIVAMARPALAKHGIAIVQSAPSISGDALEVETMLVHQSGEWISNAVHIPLAKKDPQGAGAAVTYGRRFGLSSLLSIASEEDDDGNSASRPPARQQAARPATQKVITPTIAPANAAPAKPDEEKVWGGKTLGEHTKDELQEIINEFAFDTNAQRKALVKACRNVLNNRVLGPPKAAPASRDDSDDAAVARMKAGVAAEADELPFN